MKKVWKQLGYKPPAWLLRNVSDLRTVNNKVCYLIEWEKMSSKPSSSSEKAWLLPSIFCSNRAGEFSFVAELGDSKKEIHVPTA